MPNTNLSWPPDDGFTSYVLEDAVLTKGMIVDAFVMSDSEHSANKTNRCLYPWQLPMALRCLPNVETGNCNFMSDPRYGVYLVIKTINEKTLGNGKKVRYGLISNQPEDRITDDEIDRLGARYLLPENITIDYLVFNGFFQKLERGQKSIFAVGNPYENKKFYDHSTGASLWPQNGGFLFAPIVKQLKKFSLVDRFGSDKGSYLCPVNFKNIKAKKEIYQGIITELNVYKNNFIDQMTDPFIKNLFKDGVDKFELRKKLSDTMHGMCNNYYKVVDA